MFFFVEHSESNRNRGSTYTMLELIILILSEPVSNVVHENSIYQKLQEFSKLTVSKNVSMSDLKKIMLIILYFSNKVQIHSVDGQKTEKVHNVSQIVFR